MGLLIFIGILAAIFYFAVKSNQKVTHIRGQSEENLLRQRNIEWVKFILGYRKLAKTDDAKKLINRMLGDINEQKLVDLNELGWLEDNAKQMQTKDAPQIVQKELDRSVDSSQAEGKVATSKVSATDAVATKDIQTIRLDNISLLLYFGAFLFVAAVGLFVAFAGASGWIRTLAVLFVTLALYFTGQWVYRTKVALKPAGLAFVGIGIAIAPLVGVAAYNYVASFSPQVAWFSTSLFCLALYLHALVTLRKPLINYIFIFTLLSLFESGVAIFNAPIYYFGWVLATLGLLLQGFSVWKNIWPDFQESSRSGAQIYIPLAILVSLMIIPTQGYWQFGVSLILGSLFYGLESWRATENSTKASFAVASHVSLIVGLLCIFYDATHSILQTGMFLSVLSFAHVIILLAHRSKNESEIVQNITTTMLASTVVSIFMLVDNMPILTSVLGLFVLQSLFVWWTQKRADAYIMAALSWSALPLVFGTLAITPALSVNWLILLSITALVIHIGFYLLGVRPRSDENILETGRSMLLLHIAIIVGTILFASPGIVLGSLFIVSLTLLSLSLLDKDNAWEVTSGIVISFAVIRCWSDILLLASLMVALAYNILLALRFRSEANRWFSTVLWLLWPIGLGGLTTSRHWSIDQYAWSYIGVMLGLVVSRAFARGVVFASSRIPMNTYTETASSSYVIGYITAGSLAVLISLSSDGSQLHTTAILGVLNITTFFLAWVVEKSSKIIAIQPVLAQLMLISGLRPTNIGNSMTVFVLSSTLLATACYAIHRLSEQDEGSVRYISPEFGRLAVITSFVPLGSIMYASEISWAMPLGLFVSGTILLDYWRKQTQARKEISVGIMAVSVMWYLHYLGFREVQIYSHILALMFAGFAWWRYVLKDNEVSDNYIYIALGTATLPLIMQALSGEAGGLYGWWLLIEQVVFMLIGMAIRKRFVIMWGLYVAVGSVLYQLRGLGYAAVAVLAVFVIGIAVYQLQKYNKPE